MEGLAMVDLLLASEGGGDPFAAANANAVLEALHGEACRTETCAQVGKLADEGSAECLVSSAGFMSPSILVALVSRCLPDSPTLLAPDFKVQCAAIGHIVAALRYGALAASIQQDLLTRLCVASSSPIIQVRTAAAKCLAFLWLVSRCAVRLWHFASSNFSFAHRRYIPSQGAEGVKDICMELLPARNAQLTLAEYNRMKI
jgi:hypothetical protein